MIEVRPTALQTYHERYRLVYYHLANLIHNLDADFQSLANYGHDSYTWRKNKKSQISWFKTYSGFPDNVVSDEYLSYPSLPLPEEKL